MPKIGIIKEANLDAGSCEAKCSGIRAGWVSQVLFATGEVIDLYLGARIQEILHRLLW